MNIELEDKDIEGIALRVLEMLKPYLNGNGKAEDTIFNVDGLAAYLQVAPSWVYKQVQHNKIPYFKSGKYTRFKKSVIDKWIDSETVKPIPD